MGRAADGTVRLFTNKLIRTYLAPYTESQVHEALKLTLLYGILHVQQRYPRQVLSLEQLREAVRRCADASVLEDKLPQLQRQIEGMEQQLMAFRCEVLQLEEQCELKPVAGAGLQDAKHTSMPGEAAGMVPAHGDGEQPQQDELDAVEQDEQQEQQQQQQQRLGPDMEVAHAAAVYPIWWGDPQARPAAPKPMPQRPRAQPRLAYSTQPCSGAGGALVDLDDLVTSSYLHVAPRVGSTAPPVLRPEAGQDSPVGSTAAELDAPVWVADGHEGHGAQGPARKAQQPPQSRVKQRLMAAAQQQDARQRQRQQRLVASITTATATALPAAAQQPAAGAGAVATSSSRPALIAEQVMTSRWTSWFMQPGKKAQLHAYQQACAAEVAEAEVDTNLAVAGAGSELQEEQLPAADVELGAGEAALLPANVPLPRAELAPACALEQLAGQEQGSEAGGQLLRSDSLLVLPQPGPAGFPVLQETDINKGGAGPSQDDGAGKALRAWAQAFDMSREALAAAAKDQQQRRASMAAQARSSPDRDSKGWAAAYDMSREAQYEAAAAVPLLPGCQAHKGRSPPGWSASFDISKESRAEALRLLKEAHRQL